MDIESLYFGDLRYITGLARETISIEDGSKIIDLLNKLFETYGKDFRITLDPGSSHIILINGQNHEVLGGNETLLQDGDQIVFLPITMGG